MPEIFTIKASDLVLKVSENIDPARFDISEYEAFLDALINKIKGNGDLAKETRAKYRYAVDHFQRLNNLQDEQIYYFSFLTPTDFDNFFGVLRKGKFSGYKSRLDAELKKE